MNEKKKRKIAKSKKRKRVENDRKNIYEESNNFINTFQNTNNLKKKKKNIHKNKNKKNSHLIESYIKNNLKNNCKQNLEKKDEMNIKKNKITEDKIKDDIINEKEIKKNENIKKNINENEKNSYEYQENEKSLNNYYLNKNNSSNYVNNIDCFSSDINSINETSNYISGTDVSFFNSCESNISNNAKESSNDFSNTTYYLSSDFKEEITKNNIKKCNENIETNVFKDINYNLKIEKQLNDVMNNVNYNIIDTYRINNLNYNDLNLNVITKCSKNLFDYKNNIIDFGSEEIEDNSVKIDLSSEKIEDHSEKIKDHSEKMEDHSEKIEDHSEQIDLSFAKMDFGIEPTVFSSGEMDYNFEEMYFNSLEMDCCYKKKIFSSKKKEDHSEKIEDHSEKIKDHSEKIKDHSEKIEDHSEKIKDHSEKIEDHSDELNLKDIYLNKNNKEQNKTTEYLEDNIKTFENTKEPENITYNENINDYLKKRVLSINFHSNKKHKAKEYKKLIKISTKSKKKINNKRKNIFTNNLFSKDILKEKSKINNLNYLTNFDNTLKTFEKNIFTEDELNGLNDLAEDNNYNHEKNTSNIQLMSNQLEDIKTKKYIEKNELDSNIYDKNKIIFTYFEVKCFLKNTIKALGIILEDWKIKEGGKYFWFHLNYIDNEIDLDFYINIFNVLFKLMTGKNIYYQMNDLNNIVKLFKEFIITDCNNILKICLKKLNKFAEEKYDESFPYNDTYDKIKLNKSLLQEEDINVPNIKKNFYAYLFNIIENINENYEQMYQQGIDLYNIFANTNQLNINEVFDNYFSNKIKHKNEIINSCNDLSYLFKNVFN